MNQIIEDLKDYYQGDDEKLQKIEKICMSEKAEMELIRFQNKEIQQNRNTIARLGNQLFGHIEFLHRLYSDQNTQSLFLISQNSGETFLKEYTRDLIKEQASRSSEILFHIAKKPESPFLSINNVFDCYSKPDDRTQMIFKLFDESEITNLELRSLLAQESLIVDLLLRNQNKNKENDLHYRRKIEKEVKKNIEKDFEEQKQKLVESIEADLTKRIQTEAMKKAEETLKPRLASELGKMTRRIRSKVIKALCPDLDSSIITDLDQEVDENLAMKRIRNEIKSIMEERSRRDLEKELKPRIEYEIKNDPEFIEEIRKKNRKELKKEIWNQAVNELTPEITQSLRSKLRMEIIEEIKPKIQNDLRKEMSNELEHIKERQRMEIIEKEFPKMKKDLKSQIKLKVEKKLTKIIENRLRESLSQEIRESLEPKLRVEIRRQISDEIRSSVIDHLREQITNEIENNTKKSLESQYKEHYSRILQKEIDKHTKSMNDERNTIINGIIDCIAHEDIYSPYYNRIYPVIKQHSMKYCNGEIKEKIRKIKTKLYNNMRSSITKMFEARFPSVFSGISEFESILDILADYFVQFDYKTRFSVDSYKSVSTALGISIEKLNEMNQNDIINQLCKELIDIRELFGFKNTCLAEQLCDVQQQLIHFDELHRQTRALLTRQARMISDAREDSSWIKWSKSIYTKLYGNEYIGSEDKIREKIYEAICK